MRITKKDQKGTVPGFILTVIYYVVLLAYIYKQLALFWNHNQDGFSSSDILLDLDSLGSVDFKDYQMGVGIVLYSLYEKYDKQIESIDELSSYVNIYSVQGKLAVGDVKETFTNQRKL
jgi:hypothetical protein